MMIATISRAAMITMVQVVKLFPIKLCDDQIISFRVGAFPKTNVDELRSSNRGNVKRYRVGSDREIGAPRAFREPSV